MFNSLFRLPSKKTSKLRITCLLRGESLDFPLHSANDAKLISFRTSCMNGGWAISAIHSLHWNCVVLFVSSANSTHPSLLWTKNYMQHDLFNSVTNWQPPSAWCVYFRSWFCGCPIIAVILHQILVQCQRNTMASVITLVQDFAMAFPLRTEFVLSPNRIAVHWSLQTFEHYTIRTYKIDILGTAKEVSIRYDLWTKIVRAMSPDMRGISAMCEELNYKAPEGQKSIVPLWWLPVFWRAELIICELRSVCSGLDRRQRDVINVIHLCFSIQFNVFLLRPWSSSLSILQPNNFVSIKVSNGWPLRIC